MGFRYEIRLGGDVGQGLNTIGKILAEAAAIYDNQNAIQSQSYGEEARGEANRSDIIVSDSEIVYPKVERPDLLLCFTQIAYDKYITDLKENGIVIIDSNYVLNADRNDPRLYNFSIFETAKAKFKGESQAAIIALGIVAEFIRIISPRAVQLALKARIPRGTEQLNEDCLKFGFQMARDKMDVQNVRDEN